MAEILIVGGGIGGLTLALELHRRDVPCRVFESAPEIKPLGVGVNLLPHATRVLSELGLQDALAKVAVETAAFFNRYGQLIYREPLGQRACARSRNSSDRHEHTNARTTRQEALRFDLERPWLAVAARRARVLTEFRRTSGMRPL